MCRKCPEKYDKSFKKTELYFLGDKILQVPEQALSQVHAPTEPESIKATENWIYIETSSTEEKNRPCKLISSSNNKPIFARGF